jgi:hypothetical protein
MYCACGRKATCLCDWKMPEKKSGTCDKPVCARHAKEVVPGKHLCPEHQLQYDTWRRKHPDVDVRGSGAGAEQKSLFEEAA